MPQFEVQWSFTENRALHVQRALGHE
jgi:hypothetical protein